MVPLAVIDLLQQVQMAIQHLDSKEFAMAEKEKAVGLSGAEVKGDGACLFSIPLVEDDVRLRRLKSDGI
uniref:Uncharacterized protein n=1 Tax=Neolamprologus brichardi TaxID=32507 RepID=A0A3Q4H961_NEOBR